MRFRADIYIYKTNSDNPGVEDWEEIDSFRATIQEPSERGILYIISEFMLLIKNHVDAKLKDEAIILDWGYSYKTQELSIAVFSDDYQKARNYGIRFNVDAMYESESQCGLIELLNTTYEYLNTIRDSFDFNNVWNRESLFVHASFVNGTSFQVLGKSGEFYPKPSKMYRFNGNSPDFYFELSYDGIHPIQHKFARFIVQLAYIYNDADYMAE